MKKLILLLLFTLSYSVSLALPAGYTWDTSDVKLPLVSKYYNDTLYCYCYTSNPSTNSSMRVFKGDTSYIYQINPNIYIWDFEILNDTMYAATTKGIILFSINDFTEIRRIDSSSHPNMKKASIYTLELDSNHNIWFYYADYAGVIGKFDGDSVYNYTLPDSITNYMYNEFFIKNDGSIWLEGSTFLAEFDGINQIKTLDYSNSPIMKNIDQISDVYYSKKRDEIWVSIHRYNFNVLNGAYKYNKNRIYKIKNGEWIEQNEIYNMRNIEDISTYIFFAEDNHGNIILYPHYSFKTYSQYLFCDTNNNWKSYAIADPSVYAPPRLDYIFCQITPSRKMIWQTINRGLVSVDLDEYDNKLDTLTASPISNGWTFFSRDNEARNEIISIRKANSKLFVVGFKGIDVFDGKTWKRIDTSNSGLPIDAFRIRGAELSGADLYCVTQGGLLKVNTIDLNVSYYNYNNSNLKESWYNNIAVDNNGALWFSSDSAEIIKYDKSTFTHYAIPDSIPKMNGISGQKIAIDKDNNIYFGTRCNVVKFNGSNWQVFDTSNSLIAENNFIRLVYYSKHREELYVFVSHGVYAKQACKLLRYKNNVWENVPLVGTSAYYLAITAPSFTSATEDTLGNIYFGLSSTTSKTYCDSIMMLSESDKWTTINNGAHFNSVYSMIYNTIYIDEANNLWLGDQEAGLAKCDLNIVTSVESEVNSSGLADLGILNVYPNPLKRYSKVKFYCSPDYYSSLKIRVYTVLGQEVAKINGIADYNTSTGIGTVSLPTNDIPAGYYLLNLSAKDESRTEPVIVE